jgi:hypothetical protein
MKLREKMNMVMAVTCFLSVMLNCFLALDNFRFLSASSGYLVALLMCGTIEEKDILISSLLGENDNV